MNIKVNGKNVEIRKEMKEYLEKKLSYFSKFLKQDEVINVAVSNRKELTKVEIFFKYRNEEIKAKAEKKSFRESVDACIDILKNKVSRLHAIKSRYKRDDASGASIGNKAGSEVSTEIEIESIKGEDYPEITKRKKFVLKEMTEDQALFHMYMLGHQSFIFVNKNTQTVCMLYLRDDGDCGIIEGYSEE